ncbi:hypothetical protein SSX86_010329 [Deinandra increscens subsp. villosa]|uniref:Plastid lipid-associated protein/fibrillin conserved domain-containing protein n=1 Tax=Deinandra increscens subsp. villosa TaxID=3103831 RepID=A0AAP0H2F0_9ASTR
MIPQNRHSPLLNRYARYSVDEEDGSTGYVQGRAGTVNERVGNWDGDFNENRYDDQFRYEEFNDCGRQLGQCGLDDNSINEKFDIIMELMKDIQKGNEIRDKEIKALSQQVGQLAEEVAIIRRDQVRLLSDAQRNPSHISSNTMRVDKDEVSTLPFSEISVVDTHSPQFVKGESEHDQEVKSFKRSPEKENPKEEKECFMVDRLNEKKESRSQDKEKTSRKRRRKTVNKLVEFDLEKATAAWFDSLYLDDDIRVARDIRGDYLVVDRAPY